MFLLNSKGDSCTQKESVELIVILSEALVSPSTNKQYPTLAEIYFGQYMTKQVMNVYASPCTFEFTRFPTKDKSETLSSKYVCSSPNSTKLENVFYIQGY